MNNNIVQLGDMTFDLNDAHDLRVLLEYVLSETYEEGDKEIISKALDKIN